MAVPPQVPILKFFSPSKSDLGLIEFWSAEVASYQPLDLGTAHPNSRDYAGYKLGKQFNLPNDHKFVVRIYVTDQTSPVWWNWAEKFSGEANAFPIFIREFRELRNTYAPKTKGQPLKSVYKLTLTAAGTGYTPGTLPALTFSGGAGSGAAGHAVVNQDGTIAELVLDNGGDGYTSSPTFTVAAPPSGTTATGTALVQPATAVLVAEEAQQFPQDSEFFGLYLSVIRVYETLPGPVIPFTRNDDDLGPVQGYKQAVLWNNQAPENTATGKTTHEARDASSIVAWKIVETWSNGSGIGGNPAYPIYKENLYDKEKGPVLRTTQVTTDASSGGTATLAGSLVTQTDYVPFPGNPNLRKAVKDIFVVPGPDIESTAVSDGGERVTTTRTLVWASTITTSNVVSGGTWTRTFKEKYVTDKVAWKVVVVSSDLFSKLSFSKSRPDTVPERFKASVPAITTKEVKKGAASSPTLATGDTFRSEQQIDAFSYELTITNRDISSLPTLEGQKYDEQLGVLIPYTEQVVAAGSAIGDANTEVTPLGGGLDLVTVYDLATIATAFSNFYMVFPGRANLDLPDVLANLELINEERNGEGDSSTPYFSGFWDTRGSFSVTPSATAQANQSVIPELIPTIEPTYGNNKATTRVVFLLPLPITEAAVLNRVQDILAISVDDWPDFNPRPVHAVLIGRQTSLRVEASYHIQDGGSEDSSEHGEAFNRGFSKEVGAIVKTKEISPTIHGNMGSFANYTAETTISLTADAHYDSETQSITAEQTKVEVRGAGATPGATAIPDDGYHLIRPADCSPYRFNHAMVHAEVFNFASLHP